MLPARWGLPGENLWGSDFVAAQNGALDGREGVSIDLGSQGVSLG